MAITQHNSNTSNTSDQPRPRFSFGFKSSRYDTRFANDSDRRIIDELDREYREHEAEQKRDERDRRRRMIERSRSAPCVREWPAQPSIDQFVGMLCRDGRSLVHFSHDVSHDEILTDWNDGHTVRHFWAEPDESKPIATDDPDFRNSRRVAVRVNDDRYEPGRIRRFVVLRVDTFNPKPHRMPMTGVHNVAVAGIARDCVCKYLRAKSIPHVALDTGDGCDILIPVVARTFEEIDELVADLSPQMGGRFTVAGFGVVSASAREDHETPLPGTMVRRGSHSKIHAHRECRLISFFDPKIEPISASELRVKAELGIGAEEWIEANHKQFRNVRWEKYDSKNRRWVALTLYPELPFDKTAEGKRFAETQKVERERRVREAESAEQKRIDAEIARRRAERDARRNAPANESYQTVADRTRVVNPPDEYPDLTAIDARQEAARKRKSIESWDYEADGIFPGMARILAEVLQDLRTYFASRKDKGFDCALKLFSFCPRLLPREVVIGALTEAFESLGTRGSELARLLRNAEKLAKPRYSTYTGRPVDVASLTSGEPKPVARPRSVDLLEVAKRYSYRTYGKDALRVQHFQRCAISLLKAIHPSLTPQAKSDIRYLMTAMYSMLRWEGRIAVPFPKYLARAFVLFSDPAVTPNSSNFIDRLQDRYDLAYAAEVASGRVLRGEGKLRLLNRCIKEQRIEDAGRKKGDGYDYLSHHSHLADNHYVLSDLVAARVTGTSQSTMSRCKGRLEQLGELKLVKRGVACPHQRKGDIYLDPDFIPSPVDAANDVSDNGGRWIDSAPTVTSETLSPNGPERARGDSHPTDHTSLVLPLSSVPLDPKGIAKGAKEIRFYLCESKMIARTSDQEFRARIQREEDSIPVNAIDEMDEDGRDWYFGEIESHFGPPNLASDPHDDQLF